MHQSMILTVTACIAAATLVAACVNSDTERDEEPTSIESQATWTILDGPTGSVTDQSAYELTPEQLDALREKCKEAAPIPGTNDDCLNSIPRELPLCKPKSAICLWTGRLPGVDMGAIKVEDRRPGSLACQSDKAVLCKGITVPVYIIGSLANKPTTSVSPPDTTMVTQTPPTSKSVPASNSSVKKTTS
jgi:hypothetical protein